MPQVSHAITPTGLTIKETRFVKKFLETGDGATAVEHAYDVKSRRNAHVMSKELRRKPRIKEALMRAFEKQGLTPELITEKLMTNIVDGAGVKANASDSNRGIELWAKLTGAFEKQDIDQSYKVTLHKLPTKEIIMELEKRTNQSSALLSELQNY